jgi:hypothetical protein
MIEVPFKDFEDTFKNLAAEKKPFVGIFTAEKDETGVSWCPDCNKAAPFWPEVVDRAYKQDMKTYVFLIGPEEVYKKPDHPFRTHNLIKLKYVPTLGWFDGNTFSKRL